MPLFQAVFLRGLIATALLGGLAWWQGSLRFRPGRRDRRRIGLRCVAEIGGTVCFLTALFNMPIANASAILQSLPLAVTLGAALFFDEPVGWRRYLAIAIGFVGRAHHRAAGVGRLHRLCALGTGCDRLHRDARPRHPPPHAGRPGARGRVRRPRWP